MASRGQSLTLTYVAWDTGASTGKTGDVAQHTLRWIKDGVSAAPTNAGAASEVDVTNAPGVYKVTLTTAECTCNCGTLAGKSSTSGVVIFPVTVTFEQLPTVAAGEATGLPLIETGMTLADGAVTEAKITMPSEATGVPTGALQILLWLAGRMGLRKVVKTSSTITQYMANGTTAKTSNDYTSSGTTDTIDAAE